VLLMLLLLLLLLLAARITGGAIRISGMSSIGNASLKNPKNFWSCWRLRR